MLEVRSLEFVEINKSLRKLEKKVHIDIFSPFKLPIKYLEQILFNEWLREKEREIKNKNKIERKRETEE